MSSWYHFFLNFCFSESATRAEQKRYCKIFFSNGLRDKKMTQYIFIIIISGVESRNTERTFNCALGFADKMFFQGLYVF